LADREEKRETQRLLLQQAAEREEQARTNAEAQQEFAYWGANRKATQQATLSKWLGLGGNRPTANSAATRNPLTATWQENEEETRSYPVQLDRIGAEAGRSGVNQLLRENESGQGHSSSPGQDETNGLLVRMLRQPPLLPPCAAATAAAAAVAAAQREEAELDQQLPGAAEDLQPTFAEFMRNGGHDLVDYISRNAE
jgi:hypothetical protein